MVYPVVLLLGGMLLITALSFWLYFHMDKVRREGIGILQRRRIRKYGVAGDAKVLSIDIVQELTGQRFYWLHKVIYEVVPRDGSPAFRGKGFERMFSSECSLNGLIVGGRVQVRFDRDDHAVLLIRVDTREAKRQQEQAIRDKQEALLRGRPGG